MSNADIAAALLSRDRPGYRRFIKRECKERGITVVQLWEEVRRERPRLYPKLRTQLRRMVWQAAVREGILRVDWSKSLETA